jgi:hypothetical protein
MQARIRKEILPRIYDLLVAKNVDQAFEESKKLDPCAHVDIDTKKAILGALALTHRCKATQLALTGKNDFPAISFYVQALNYFHQVLHIDPANKRALEYVEVVFEDLRKIGRHAKKSDVKVQVDIEIKKYQAILQAEKNVKQDEKKEVVIEEPKRPSVSLASQRRQRQKANREKRDAKRALQQELTPKLQPVPVQELAPAPEKKRVTSKVFAAAKPGIPVEKRGMIAVQPAEFEHTFDFSTKKITSEFSTKTNSSSLFTSIAGLFCKSRRNTKTEPQEAVESKYRVSHTKTV